MLARQPGHETRHVERGINDNNPIVHEYPTPLLAPITYVQQQDWESEDIRPKLHEEFIIERSPGNLSAVLELVRFAERKPSYHLHQHNAV